MGHHTTFKPCCASFLKGAEFGVSIEDPRSAADNLILLTQGVSVLLAQVIDLLSDHVLDRETLSEIAVRQAAASSVSMLATSRQQLEMAAGVIDAIYPFLLRRSDAAALDLAETEGQQDEPPLRRAVRTLRAEQKVGDAIAAIRQRTAGAQSKREV